MHTKSRRLAIRLRSSQWDRIQRTRGLRGDADVAATLGVARATIFRIRTGRIDPGTKFIAAMLEQLGLRFEEIFEVVEVDDLGRARSE